MSTRAARRHNARRMRQRAKHVWERVWHRDPNGQQTSRMADNVQQCSCWSCGNPRRHFGAKTRQEKRADHDRTEQMRD